MIEKFKPNNPGRDLPKDLVVTPTEGPTMYQRLLAESAKFAPAEPNFLDLVQNPDIKDEMQASAEDLSK